MNTKRRSTWSYFWLAPSLLSCTWLLTDHSSSSINLQCSATPTDQAPTTSAAATSTQGGEKQPVKCRDPIFALLLYGNVGAIAAVAAIYGSKAFEGVNEGGYNYNGYIYAAFILGIIAMVFTGFCLPIMMCIPEVLIKVSLIGMLLLSGVMMVISFISGNIIGGIFGVIFFAIFACYTRAGKSHNIIAWALRKGRWILTFLPSLLQYCNSLVSYPICQR